jgi:hypothetical protein
LLRSAHLRDEIIEQLEGDAPGRLTTDGDVEVRDGAGHAEEWYQVEMRWSRSSELKCLMSLRWEKHESKITLLDDELLSPAGPFHSWLSSTFAPGSHYKWPTVLRTMSSDSTLSSIIVEAWYRCIQRITMRPEAKSHEVEKDARERKKETEIGGRGAD